MGVRVQPAVLVPELVEETVVAPEVALGTWVLQLAAGKVVVEGVALEARLAAEQEGFTQQRMLEQQELPALAEAAEKEAQALPMGTMPVVLQVVRVLRLPEEMEAMAGQEQQDPVARPGQHMEPLIFQACIWEEEAVVEEEALAAVAGEAEHLMLARQAAQAAREVREEPAEELSILKL